jgi:putative ABC transport system ATP-binding protein
MVGIVFQFFHLRPALSALEKVLVPLELAGAKAALSRAHGLLAAVGLTGREHHYPSQLSGGEQQRVAIARALANHPRLLLADEPTGNLDSANGAQVVDLLFDVSRAERATLVLATHDPALAARARGRLALLDGRAVERPPWHPAATAVASDAGVRHLEARNVSPPEGAPARG